MKVNFVGELRNVAKGKEFNRKNGETDFNVNISVEVDGVPQYFSTNKDVLKAFENGVIKKGSICTFEADYQPRWKFNQFIVVSAVAQR